MAPESGPSVCYWRGAENGNSKSSVLLLSGCITICVPFPRSDRPPLDQMGTIDPAALHFKLIVLEMRCTHSTIPASGSLYLFIFVGELMSDKRKIFNSRRFQFSSKKSRLC